MANVLCLDFDDTIVVNNTVNLVFEEFAGERRSWLEEGGQLGRMSVEQRNAALLDSIEAPREELYRFVQENAQVRPGFAELIAWANGNGWYPTVVSNAYDFCVDAVLDGLSLDRVVRHCGRTQLDYRWRVRYESPRGIEVADGFKVSYAAAFKNAGDFVVYAGDGASDVPPADLARAVFARGRLWTGLKDVHPRIYPFETFHDVITVLDRDASDWLAAFASRPSDPA